MDTPINDKFAEPARHPKAEGFAHIAGWGVGLDHANRPGYPMELHPPGPVSAAPLARQKENADVLHSIERPGLTAVFGTTCPPRGVSGALRRAAFRFSESDLRHWLMLLFADRVDVVQGVASDLAKGRVPNLYREMGGPAALRHNPGGVVKKVLLVASVAGVGYWIWKRRASSDS